MTARTRRSIERLVVALGFCSLTVAGCIMRAPDDGGDDEPRAYSTDDGTSGGSNGSNGSKSCPEIVDCIGNCPENDEGCAQNCADQGTPRAQEAFDGYARCFSNNNCESGECICRNCRAEVQQCGLQACNGSGSGSSSGGSCAVNSSMNCSELLDCTTCCESDQCLDQQCGANSTQTAVERYNALIECSNQNNCGQASDTQQCLSNNCGTELRACAG